MNSVLLINVNNSKEKKINLLNNTCMLTLAQAH
jgi:hypothetical protein